MVTRQHGWSADGVFVGRGPSRTRSPWPQDFDGDVMVIGGAQVYAAAMPLADVQVLTEVHQARRATPATRSSTGRDWTETRREPHDGYEFVWLERTGS